MARPSVVLDTNIVVSAHLRAKGLERLVLDLALNRRVQLVFSTPILSEYEEILLRPKFKIDPALVVESLRLIRDCGQMIAPRRNLAVMSDPDDNIFVECAEAAKAVYLVTGNKRLSLNPGD